MGGDYLSDGYYSRKDSMCGQVTIFSYKKLQVCTAWCKKANSLIHKQTKSLVFEIIVKLL